MLLVEWPSSHPRGWSHELPVHASTFACDFKRLPLNHHPATLKLCSYAVCMCVPLYVHPRMCVCACVQACVRACVRVYVCILLSFGAARANGGTTCCTADTLTANLHARAVACCCLASCNLACCNWPLHACAVTFCTVRAFHRRLLSIWRSQAPALWT